MGSIDIWVMYRRKYIGRNPIIWFNKYLLSFNQLPGSSFNCSWNKHKWPAFRVFKRKRQASECGTIQWKLWWKSRRWRTKVWPSGRAMWSSFRKWHVKQVPKFLRVKVEKKKHITKIEGESSWSEKQCKD